MATEEQKKQNLVRLLRMALYGLTVGTWDLLGESAYGISRQIGAQILPVMEKEMGLEIAGESPKDMLQEMGRLFVDEFGFAREVTVSEEGDKLVMKVRGCLNFKFTDDLQAAGVEWPFICPYMCAATVALERMGIKARASIQRWPEGAGSIITFELI